MQFWGLGGRAETEGQAGCWAGGRQVAPACGESGVGLRQWAVSPGPAGRKLWRPQAGWRREGLAEREEGAGWQQVTKVCVSGGRLASSSHPGAHGSGGLSH